MAWRLPGLLLSLLLLAPSTAVANILPRQTTFSNSTVSSTPTKTASSGTTPPPCCWIAAGGTALGLHKWYTSTVDHVVATVITTYIRENNGSAVAANSTTLYVAQNQTTFPEAGEYPYVLNPTWPMVEIPGVPTTLINQDVGWNGGDYCATVVNNNTAVSFDFTDLVIAQPTPFDVWFVLGIYTQTPNSSQHLPTGLTAWPRESCGTWAYNTYTDVEATTLTVDGSVTTSFSSGSVITSSAHVPSGKSEAFLPMGRFVGGGGIDSLNVTYVQPKTEQVPDGKPWLPIPTGLKDWLGTQEEIVEKYPFIKDCWLDQGNGQPSVHVPVNQLTITSSHIIDVQKATTKQPGSRPNTAKTQTSLDVPQSPRTQNTKTSLDVPQSPRTQETQTSLDNPTIVPADTQETTLGVPRTEIKQTTLDAPETTTTTAWKAQTQKTATSLDGPEGSPATADQPDTAVEVQTTQGKVNNPTPSPTVGKPDNNDNRPPSSDGDDGQPSNDKPEETEGKGGTQVQDTAPQTTSGVGGLVSAIQSVASQQAGAPSPNSQNNQQDTPNRPVAVITTPAPGNRPTESVTGFAISSQTASPGGAAITRGGSTFSALPSGSGLQVVANGQTSTIVNEAPQKLPVAQGPGSGDNYVVGDSTLNAGGAAITSGGSTYSALPGGSGIQVVADGKTEIVPGSSPAGFQVATIADSDIGYIVGAKTLTAGGPATTFDGATFSALPSAGGVLVISDGQTSTVPIVLSPASPSNVQLGKSEGEYLFADNTLTAGGQAITSEGATYSALPSNGGVLVVSDGQTRTVPVVLPAGPSGVQLGKSEGEYLFADNTLTAGGKAITSEGATFSALPSNGGVLVISNGQTSTVAASSPKGSQSVQPGSSEGEYVFVSTTLTAGGAALTSAGTTYSALPSGSGIAIAAGGSTSTATIGEAVSGANTAGSDSGLPTPVLLPANPEQLVTVGDSTYTARITDGSLLVLGSATIRPGITTVVDGETLLLTGSNLVLATGTSSSTRGLGDAIMSGIGGGSGSDDNSDNSSDNNSNDEGSSSSESSAAQPTSGAGRRSMPDVRVLAGGLVSLLFALVFVV